MIKRRNQKNIIIIIIIKRVKIIIVIVVALILKMKLIQVKEDQMKDQEILISLQEIIDQMK